MNSSLFVVMCTCSCAAAAAVAATTPAHTQSISRTVFLVLHCFHMKLPGFRLLRSAVLPKRNHYQVLLATTCRFSHANHNFLKISIHFPAWSIHRNRFCFAVAAFFLSSLPISKCRLTSSVCEKVQRIFFKHLVSFIRFVSQSKFISFRNPIAFAHVYA